MIFDQLALFRLPTEPASPRERFLQIGGNVVTYTLRQANHRRISMTIDERGLRVGAPRHVRLGEVEDFVRIHGEWVLIKLKEFACSHSPRHLAIRDGVLLPVLGGESIIHVLPGGNRVRWVGETLVLEARPTAALNTLARRGLQKRALELFVQRVAHYAVLMEREPPAVALTSARTRWGSCSLRSGIRLNWRLIHLPLHLIDYVVAHEMAHLIEMNHSAKFWREVEQLYPNWQDARDELKTRATSIPLI